MKIFKTAIQTILFSITLYANDSSLTTLCFTSDKEEVQSFCPNDSNHTILKPSIDFSETIETIQMRIRQTLTAHEEQKVILMGQGVEGTLLAIAQTNLLPFYRQNIHGLVLKDAPANFYKSCMVDKSSEHNQTCHDIKNFQLNLNGLASELEALTALSPALQMDWYWAKSLIIEESEKERKLWIDAFKESGVKYDTIQSTKAIDLAKHFPLHKSSKIQPQKSKKIPTHHGATLRYHLSKISYKSKEKIIAQKDIGYGESKEQQYDVFFKEKSKNNPLMIYVHGGGWSLGDKIYFHNFCKQYADMGFTAVSLNYRLLNLPTVGMKEMVKDVTLAIEDIMKSASTYHADANRTVIMAESAGAQLAFMAITQLPYKSNVKATVFNSITSNLKLHPKPKQIRLSGITNEKERQAWLNAYSPLFSQTPSNLHPNITIEL